MAETPVSIKDLKPGNYVMVDGEPCKVVDIVKSKPGKHGATKARIDTMGIFDGKRRFILKPTASTVNTPIIDKKRAQVISVTGEVAQLMDMEDYTTFEASIPEEFKGRIEPGREIVYWKLAGKVLIKELR
jgi:translation initiation factor 5A